MSTKGQLAKVKAGRTGIDLVVHLVAHALVACSYMDADAEDGGKRKDGGVLRDEVERRRLWLEEVLADAGEGGRRLESESVDALLQVLVLEGAVDHAAVGVELPKANRSQRVSSSSQEERRTLIQGDL